MYKEPIVVVVPASEPISLEEATAHVRQDSSDDDGLLQNLITAARMTVELHTGRALVSRTLQSSFDGFGCLLLPYPPLSEVLSVTYYDKAETSALVSSAIYQVDTAAEPGRIVLRRGYTWPTITLRPRNGVVVEYVAGYGDADQVPWNLKQAILMLVQHWYRNPDGKEIPDGFNRLLAFDNVYA